MTTRVMGLWASCGARNGLGKEPVSLIGMPRQACDESLV